VDEQLDRLALLLRQRNALDADIGSILGRPMTSGHAGEWIGSRVFDIELEASATAAAIDGRFRTGPLAGRTVNVKWYLLREGALDMTESDVLDYYLVVTGPPATAATARQRLRPWVITNVYLFDARALAEDLRGRGRRIGTASSVRNEHWAAAEVYPRNGDRVLQLTQQQRDALARFHP
jgi:hypothetical protein